MAIIKCPECGHQISDKAPTCPSCGVEIAGHITRCPQCGTVYLNEQDSCPICHHANDNTQPFRKTTITTPPPIPAAQQEKAQQPEQPPKKKKRSWGALLFSLFLALVICGVCFYFYHNAKDTKETEAYTYAMT
ncbi:MAG: zinc-ribbon domain-containing protein, partial [Prevotella sp.]|nr:zinc-ribbon domain-containing protein [Prevotella sp.]